MTDDLADFFQPSYRISREKLLAGAHRLAPLHGVCVDSRALEQRGPEGETLALDFTIVGARRPKHALVVTSGTHGVEGFTGSAVQHWMLEVLLPRLKLGPDTAVILQHANNPWGFAWTRRVNENNVDFNRNFLERFDPTLCSADYELLYDVLNPPDLDPANEAARLARLDAFVAEHGARRFQTAASEGQYKYPEGLQFGGQELQPGARHLLALVSEHLSQAQTVAWLDFHTGLGTFAACELITGADPDSPSHRFSQQLWRGAVKAANAGDSVSPPLIGVMDRGLARTLPADCRFAVAAPEYGTYEMNRVMMALRADNWLHHRGDPTDATGRAIKAEILEVFRPANRDWMREIVRSGGAYVEQALEHLPGVGRR